MKNTKMTCKRKYFEAEFKEFEPRLNEGEKSFPGIFRKMKISLYDN